jgi:hypothetical protein
MTIARKFRKSSSSTAWWDETEDLCQHLKASSPLLFRHIIPQSLFVPDGKSRLEN